jgi:TolB-like protein
MNDLLQRLAPALEGRYRIERELGAGGMATVYLARDERHDRSVAVKVLRQDLAASLGAERFHREIRIAAGLQHPHVVPLYDSGDAGGLLFYVMPFVDGISLRQRLQKEGELPVAEAVRILRDIADALTAAHDHGVIHRDLKPENVMLAGRHALVTDFGVAKAVREATELQTLTSLGMALGTPTYMAPEQVSADPQLDHRADIYAFGVVAYELLAGHPPFRGGTPQETLAAHLSATPESISTQRPGIPDPLAALVMRCLEKRPADRVQKAEELIPQLESLLATSGETAPVGRWRSGTGRRRRRNFIVGVIAIVGLVIGGAIWMPRSGGRSLNPATVLVASFENDPGAPNASSLAQLLQSEITQGLQRIGIVEVVGGLSTTPTGSTGAAASSAGMQLARHLGAGLVVQGRLLVVGDSVQVQARLVSTQDGAEVIPVPTVVGTFAGRGTLVGAVVERLKGAILLHRDPRAGADFPGTRAPTYEAYREFQRGNDHFNSREFAQAAVRFRKAFQMDTTFVAAALQFVNARGNSGGGCAAADSVENELESQRSLVSPVEAQVLNRQLAGCRGDLTTFVSAAREIGRLAPASPTAQYLSARSPLYGNYVTESRDRLLALDKNSPQLLVAGFYNDVTDAFHKLGDHYAELRWAREWQRNPRNQQPVRARAAEALALAALGRIDEVRQIFPQFLTTGAVGDFRDVGRAIRVLEELRWHGYDSVARDLSREALAGPASAFLPGERIRLMAYSGDIDGASKLADSIRQGQPGADLRWSGMLSAARGDHASAEAILGELERDIPRYDRGERIFSRALILSLLGEKDLATRLLRQAHAEGRDFLNEGFHAQFGLEPLRGFASFEDFVKPR